MSLCLSSRSSTERRQFRSSRAAWSVPQTHINRSDQVGAGQRSSALKQTSPGWTLRKPTCSGCHAFTADGICISLKHVTRPSGSVHWPSYEYGFCEIGADFGYTAIRKILKQASARPVVNGCWYRFSVDRRGLPHELIISELVLICTPEMNHECK